ncbi:unnamed protein product [Pleuronectes platessa]|uniref:Uncharacterized protein n=1 Tax=Pleuronectes platessa TaxID=8262 RepID=A0A9N7VIJ2_PLEPL|nr:unnamed protein product [Pleuronectes platessa]
MSRHFGDCGENAPFHGRLPQSLIVYLRDMRRDELQTLYNGAFWTAASELVCRGHFALQMGQTGYRPPTFRLENDHSTPQPQPPWWTMEVAVVDPDGGSGS